VGWTILSLVFANIAAWLGWRHRGMVAEGRPGAIGLFTFHVKGV
jgi:hypothetical protein